MKFGKPAISIRDQVSLLQRRGMIIRDVALAQHSLKFLSYYRLRAYWLPFESATNGSGDHAFRQGTTIEAVLALYKFDRRLRLLLLDAIEQVEIAFRGHWAHNIAIRYGPHGYLRSSLYARKDHFERSVSKLREEFNRSRDTFAEHYRKKYETPELPPIWMAAETISLGQLSMWIRNLKSRADRKIIADSFGLDERAFTSFCHHVSYVRNICAHHGRLWNKRFTVTMTIPKRPTALAEVMAGGEPRKVFCTLVMLDFLLSTILPGNDWRQRVISLIDNCASVNPRRMGFPADWRHRSNWEQSPDFDSSYGVSS